MQDGLLTEESRDELLKALPGFSRSQLVLCFAASLSFGENRTNSSSTRRFAMTLIREAESPG